MALARKEIERRRMLGAKRGKVSYLIAHKMRQRGFTGNALAQKAGCSKAAVSSTILGKTHCPRVLDALKEIGIPERLLFDPRKTEAA